VCELKRPSTNSRAWRGASGALTKVGHEPVEYTLVVFALKVLALEVIVDLSQQPIQVPAVDVQVRAAELDKIHERCKMVNRVCARKEKQTVNSE
jgi:hypothetical protein